MRKNKVHYEWVVEHLADDSDLEWLVEHGQDPDILDVIHCKSYGEAVDISVALHGPYRIVLVRDMGNEEDGMIDRTWAYVVDDKLPDNFDYGNDEEGPRVPKRFHKEVEHVTPGWNKTLQKIFKGEV